MDAVDEARSAPAALFVGKVMHARIKPKPHRFIYRVFMILLDLDRLDEAGRLSRLMSINRFNLLSFRPDDHLLVRPDLAGTLPDRARRLFAAHGVNLEGCRILLLCLPRVLGYAFNPISIFYAVDPSGELRGALYEVRNTFGERHCYVAAASEAGARLRHTTRKAFHVSPFLPMNLDYRFSVTAPGESLLLRIVEHDEDGAILSTALEGNRRILTGFNILRTLVSLPLVTLKVIFGIHFEAVRLLLKGVRVHPHPERNRGG